MIYQPFPFRRLTEGEIAEFVSLCMIGKVVAAASPYPEHLREFRQNWVDAEDLLLVRTIFQTLGEGAFGMFAPEDIERIGIWWNIRGSNVNAIDTPKLAYGAKRAYPIFPLCRVMLEEDWQIAQKSLLKVLAERENY